MKTHVKTNLETIDASQEGNPVSYTLNEWYVIWLQEYKMDRVKPSTLQNYSSIYRNQIQARIGSMPIREIHAMHIQRMYNELREKGISPKYQHCIHAILSNMFDIAIQNDLLSKNPCQNVRMDALRSKEERFLSAEEHRLLLQTSLLKEWEPLSCPIILLLGTGIRVGELLGLTWDNIAMQTRHIYIEKTLVYLWNAEIGSYAFSFQTPKTCHSRRCIPMSQTIVDTLQKQREIVAHFQKDQNKWNPLPGFENLVFPNSHGRPQQRRDIQHLLDQLIETINQHPPVTPQGTPCLMGHIHPHTLRHSFATRCFEAGIQPKVVQTLLGHSSIQLTMDLYTHVSLDKCRKDMEKLQQFGI